MGEKEPTREEPAHRLIRLRRSTLIFPNTCLPAQAGRSQLIQQLPSQYNCSAHLFFSVKSTLLESHSTRFLGPKNVVPAG